MSSPTSDLFEIVVDCEARIGSLRLGDSYSLYEMMYDAAARLGPIGCFYICLYNPETESLHFAYNRDGDALEEPITLPLGTGPTSWVIRNKRPFVLTDTSTETQRAGIAFGDRSRVSNSAVHLPMRTIGPDGSRQLIGVMSAQSYEHNVYGPQQIGILQALADRVARILHYDSGHDACVRRIMALEAELERHRIRSMRLTDEFIERLTAASHRAHDLLAMTPSEYHELREAEVALHRSLHKLLTTAAEVPADFDEAHSEIPPLSPLESVVPVSLTERERQIAGLLASGRSNASIAESLYISVDTVKFHCANIYRKLGVRNRVQAVQAAADLLRKVPG